MSDQKHTDHIEIGQQLMPTLSADPSVFFVFFSPHFFLILASRTNSTFGFGGPVCRTGRHTSRPFAKPKEPFFAKAQNDIMTLNNYLSNLTI